MFVACAFARFSQASEISKYSSESTVSIQLQPLARLEYRNKRHTFVCYAYIEPRTSWGARYQQRHSASQTKLRLIVGFHSKVLDPPYHEPPNRIYQQLFTVLITSRFVDLLRIIQGRA